MGHHTFDADRADALESAERRYSVLSVEELRRALDLSPDDTVIDLGSGTGFYTDDVAPHAGAVYAVALLTAPINDIPIDSGCADGAFSTMTYHEFASPAATVIPTIGNVTPEPYAVTTAAPDSGVIASASATTASRTGTVHPAAAIA
jgi:hypothetical protein